MRKQATERSGSSGSTQQKVSVAAPQPEPAPIVSQERHRRVAEVAYYLAERRGFEPGHEMEDWLEAEKTIVVSSDRQT